MQNRKSIETTTHAPHSAYRVDMTAALAYRSPPCRHRPLLLFLGSASGVRVHRQLCTAATSTSSFAGTRLRPALPSHGRHRPWQRRRPPRASSSWHESLLPADPDIPSLHSLYSSFPKLYTQAFILGLDGEAQQTAYVTSHEKLTNTRPAYAISSDAFPIPLPHPQSNVFVRHSLAHIYPNTSALPDPPPLIPNASMVTSLIPRELHSFLGIDHISANSIMYSLSNDTEHEIGWNRASNALAILHACQTRIAGAAIIDAPSPNNDASTISIGGVVYLEKRVASMYGEAIYSDPVGLAVDASFAVAVANAADAPCFLDRHMFDVCSVRIDDMQSVFKSCGNRPVTVKRSHVDSGDFAEYFEQLEQNDANTKVVGELWQLTANDVLSMSDDQMRAALRREEVAVRDKESRSSLLGKLVPFLDEVHRRDLGIRLAADQEMYQLASSLQQSRSPRGILFDKLREAEKQQNWTQVAKLAAELKRLEQQTQDITAEPGSYNPDLDQDDWYRPCR